MRKLYYSARNQIETLVVQVNEDGMVRSFHFDSLNFHYSCAYRGKHVVKHVSPSDETRLRPIMHKIQAGCAAGHEVSDMVDVVEATLIKYPMPKGVVLTQKVKMKPAPGYRLRHYLRLVCTKAFAERELDALVADGNEYYAELLANKQWKSAEIYKWTLRGQMLWTVAGGLVSSVMKAALGKRQSSE